MAEEINTFEGTREAFNDLVSKREWYKGIKVGGLPLKAANAWQIKVRLQGNKKVSTDYMEEILQAAGYRIYKPVIWQKNISAD